MARLTVAGHSLHAIMNDWPIGLFTTGLVFDSISLATRNERLAKAGFYSLVAGYVTGVAAALTGVAEYRAIEKEGKVRKLANRHTVANIGMMSFMTGALLMRRKKPEQVGALPLSLSLAGNALLFVSAWLGDEMVYGHQVRVRDGHIKHDDRDLRLPGDEQIASAFRFVGTDDASAPTRTALQ